MRIRKNKKLTASEIVGSSSIPPESLQAHVCLLNRSPWDLLPPPSSANYQDDSLGLNGSLKDSIKSADSGSMKLSSGYEEMRPKEEDNDDSGGRDSRTSESLDDAVPHVVVCSKNDGKGWQCGRSSMNGHCLCDYHLARALQCHHHQNHPPSIPSPTTPGTTTIATTIIPKKRGRPRKNAAAPAPMAPVLASISPCSNPYEYYYYAGFGPWWGSKRRGGSSKEESEAAMINNDENYDAGKRCYSSLDKEDLGLCFTSDDILFEDSEELDYIGDKCSEEENDNGSGGGSGRIDRRRGRRKPVKARSLKSLM